MIFDAGNLIDTPCMAPPLEGGLQPDADHPFDDFLSEQIRRQAEDVGVVVAPTHLRGDAVVARSRTHSLYLVGSDAHSDAGATDQNAPLTASFTHRLRNLKGEVWIIDALRGVRSHIDDFVMELST